MYTCMHVCTAICMYPACMHACMHIATYVCVHNVCMYVCIMYACMYVYNYVIYMHTCVYICIVFCTNVNIPHKSCHGSCKQFKAFILFKVSKLCEGDDSLIIKQYPQFYNYATVLNGICTTVVAIIFYSFHLAIVHVHNA